MNISDRAQKITPFYVMELLEKARAMEAEGENIVHMEVGEPDFATPEEVKEGALKAIRENHTFYTHSLGLLDLRERIARSYQEDEGVDIPAERIVITNGTSGALLLLCATLLNNGDVLALSDPGYPCYRNFGLLVGAKTVSLPVSEETRFEVTGEHLESLGGTPKMVIISHPSNPTGIVYRQETIARLQGHLSDNHGLLVVDEIYLGLTYGQRVRTSLALSDQIVVVNGFSKTYAMTGWRLGWMVIPEGLIRPVQKIAQNIFISPPSISQYAALHAFELGNQIDMMRKTYEKRRNFLLPRLKGLGFSIPVDPEGAFYVYAGIEKWGLDSMEFSERALAEAKVAFTPGYDFGSYRASSHVRFCYANSLEMIEEGCRRLEEWLQTL